MLPLNKLCLIPILFFYFAAALYAETPNPSDNIKIFEDNIKEQQKEYRELKERQAKKKKPIYIEPFCRNLEQAVTYWQMTAEEIQECKNNGFGYNELIKVILISKKAERKLEDVIKRRRRGESFEEISKRYKVDYAEIKKETKQIRSEVKTYGTN